MFKKGRFLDQVYQGIINLTHANLDVPCLKTMFGAKKRPYQTVKRRANLFHLHHAMIEEVNLNQLAKPVLKGKTQLAGINVTPKTND